MDIENTDNNCIENEILLKQLPSNINNLFDEVDTKILKEYKERIEPMIEKNKKNNTKMIITKQPQLKNSNK